MVTTFSYLLVALSVYNVFIVNMHLLLSNDFYRHIDGNHKLISWRMVFHGCVDGYSRTIIYLECLTNNRGSSVLSLFQEGVRNFGLPSRVRSDRGTENMEVARFMLRMRGSHRRSIIVGRSVHNQRIERLWAELNRVVSYFYADLFTFMETQNILDSLSELHLFALHYVFLPRIQRSVRQFRSQWNNHGLSTENSRTPLQLWFRGIISHIGQDVTGVNGVLEPLDETADGATASPTNLQGISVPDNIFEVTHLTMTEIQQLINPLSEDGNFGINLFITLVNFLEMTREGCCSHLPP